MCRSSFNKRNESHKGTEHPSSTYYVVFCKSIKFLHNIYLELSGKCVRQVNVKWKRCLLILWINLLCTRNSESSCQKPLTFQSWGFEWFDFSYFFFLECTNYCLRTLRLISTMYITFVKCNVQEIPQMAKGVHHVSGSGTMYILVSEVKTALWGRKGIQICILKSTCHEWQLLGCLMQTNSEKVKEVHC